MKQKLFHMALASFIFSVLGIFFFQLWYFSIIIGLYAISKINQNKNLKGKKFAYAAIILSAALLTLFWQGFSLSVYLLQAIK